MLSSVSALAAAMRETAQMVATAGCDDGQLVSCVAEYHGRFLGVPSLGVVIQTSENAAIKHKYSLESRHGVVVTKVVEVRRF